MFSSQRLRADRIDTIRRYYRSPKFALIDLAFGLVALFINPYRMCRKFLARKRCANIHAYGETPFTTYERIVKECGIGPDDVWMELGAGRGKGCFWLAHFVGCRVIGVEWIPTFVSVAKAIQRLFGLKNVRFEQSDMEQIDLSQATVIYLYGHHPQLKISKGTRVISISEPLSGLTVIKTFWVRYPWGRTTAYLQTIDF
jgi:hypothetical protein